MTAALVSTPIIILRATTAAAQQAWLPYWALDMYQHALS